MAQRFWKRALLSLVSTGLPRQIPGSIWTAEICRHLRQIHSETETNHKTSFFVRATGCQLFLTIGYFTSTHFSEPPLRTFTLSLS